MFHQLDRLLRLCCVRLSLGSLSVQASVLSGLAAAGLAMTVNAGALAPSNHDGSHRRDTTQLVSRALLANVASDGPYQLTPERRALLNTIRYAEGTWKDGTDQGYQVMYGGGKFHDLSRHPETVVIKRYASAAAGAYQFLPATWKGVAKELDLETFEPKHQDQAALHLVQRRGALKEIDRSGLTKTAMARLAPEWASFPNISGRSAYGQPVKTHQELARFYSENLQSLRRQNRPA